MNCEQARQIDMVSFLYKIGIKPIRESNTVALYRSPLRKDLNPSFIVDKKRNLYYDRGTGDGGSIIDLGIGLFSCSKSDLLKKLEKQSYSFRQQNKFTIQTCNNIISVNPILNRYLIAYAIERGIQANLLKQYCKEVTYLSNGKQLYGIGFENIKSGYEIRNKFYKGCIAPKVISHIKNESKVCCVFEGFFDYLSFLVLKKSSFPISNFIILNSTAQVDHGISYMCNYEKIYLFLDNDQAGKIAKEKIRSKYPEKVKDYSWLYKGYKDLNDYLINKKSND